MGNELWLVILLFLWAMANRVRTSSEPSARRKKRYLRSRLASLTAAYGDLIRDQFPRRYMELVAYAILIYEMFNRPWVARAIEHAVFPWGSKTLGPMQVRTNRRLSDRESIQEGVRQLREHFQTTIREKADQHPSRYEIIERALAKYNRDENYVSEVIQLLHILWAQVATDYRLEFENMYRPEPPAAERAETSTEQC